MVTGPRRPRESSPTFQIILSRKGDQQSSYDLHMTRWPRYIPLPRVAISYFSDTGGRTKACYIYLTSRQRLRMPWPSVKSTNKGQTDPVEAGDVEDAIFKCANIWASLPGNAYAQGGHSADALVAQWNKIGRKHDRDRPSRMDSSSWCRAEHGRLLPSSPISRCAAYA